MYAVIRAGGKQHRVTKGERLRVEKLDGEVGHELTLPEVLLVGGEGEPKIGAPHVKGAKVTAKIVTQGKSPRVEVFKRRKRKGFHKLNGHRQPFTEIEITGIVG